MKRALIVIASVVTLGAVALVVHARMRSGPHHVKFDTSKVEAASVDQADTSVSIMAMLEAPDAATPCETAYAAADAEQRAAKLRGAKSIFQWVAPKADFLAQCQALAPAVQQCMMPRYRRDHADACLRARPDPDVLKKLMVGVPVADPTAPAAP